LEKDEKIVCWKDEVNNNIILLHHSFKYKVGFLCWKDCLVVEP